MIYTLDLLIGIYTIITGFCCAWIALRLAAFFGWDEPRHLGRANANPLASTGEFLLTALIGPRLLFRNAISYFRSGELTPVVFAASVIVSGIWAGFLGVIVLQVAYVSGFFLA